MIDITLRLTVFKLFAIKWQKSVSERPKILQANPAIFGFVYSANADGGRGLCVFGGVCVDM